MQYMKTVNMHIRSSRTVENWELWLYSKPCRYSSFFFASTKRGL